MLTIIDYGVGNLASIANMLAYLGVAHRIANEPADILSAQRLVLPGIGAFDAAMDKLHGTGLLAALHQRVMADKVPVLGICLGMQLMCQSSQEGRHPGLAWFDAEVQRFDAARMDKPGVIPHMGWNEVQTMQPQHPVLVGLPQSPRYYFVHSYHVVCHDPSDELLRCQYGYAFAAAIARDNLLAVQFHPEKSHRFGMALLANFANWQPACSARD